jgi:hypothetical protein
MADNPDAAASLNYAEVAERTREIVMKYAKEEWPLYKSSNDVEVSVYENSDPDAPGKAYKSVGIVNAAPSTTLEYILPGPLRLHWDKQIKSCELVTTVEEV